MKKTNFNKFEASTEGGWWKPLAWFFLILVGLWILWYYTGGPQRAALEQQGPFMQPSAPLGNGSSYSLGN